MSNTVLDIKSLTRSYDKFTVFDGVTLSVNAGEIFGLLGLNGAENTTTILASIGSGLFPRLATRTAIT